MTRILCAAAIACAFVLASAAAYASPACDNNGRCVDRSVAASAGLRSAASAGETIIIGGRPAGCPHRYCGCGLRKHLGLDDVRLNLAWNWAKLFPRATLRDGVAAVRPGHVLYVIRVIDRDRRVVLARDYNSGGGLSRIHERRLSGRFVFVNPHQRMVSR